MKRTLVLVVALAAFLFVYIYLPTLVERRCKEFTHHLSFHGGGTCSATAIGPHAILSAAHCDPNGNAALVEFLTGEKPKHRTSMKIDETNVEIVGSIFDGQDHVIRLLSGITFARYARFSQLHLEQGDKFFLYGEPADNWGALRHGYVMSVVNTDEGYLALLDLNGYYGDSGAAMFNWQGDIVGTVNFVKTYPSDGPDPQDSTEFKMMGAPDFGFRQSDIDMAQKF